MDNRPFSGPADLEALKAFQSDALATGSHAGLMHPGDAVHRVESLYRRHDPNELVRIWEDDAGIAGWVMVSPNFAAFEIQVHPGRPELNAELVTWGFEAAATYITENGIDKDHVTADGYAEDAARIEALSAAGFTRIGGDSYIETHRQVEPLPEVRLPTGYKARTVYGPEDAELLADVHNGAFSSSWTGEGYAERMSWPGYDPDREIVIEAPDGTLAAFTIVWFDRRNGIGLFEPVGVDSSHRRLGLGQAIMGLGLHRMADEGMTTAWVTHEGSNRASKGLYAAAGFTQRSVADDWTKPIES
ncbi:MAG: GNAT family N-acetyltransferase [Acidimicrobiia bacterium]|nr:GNAT family N-acetyltransferase [Acidimicrobiia bacterium]NNK91968.1 GNAT family N-acetyltransferase [Acidimicrobiia bacterium]